VECEPTTHPLVNPLHLIERVHQRQACAYKTSLTL